MLTKAKRVLSFILVCVAALALPFTNDLSLRVSAAQSEALKVGVLTLDGLYDPMRQNDFTDKYLSEFLVRSGYNTEMTPRDTANTVIPMPVMIDMLDGGSVDMLVGVAKQQGQGKTLQFSRQSIGMVRLCVTAPNDERTAGLFGDNGTEISATQLSGKNIGFVMDWYGNELFAAFAKERDFIYNPMNFNTEDELRAAVNAGSVDAAVYPQYLITANDRVIIEYGVVPLYIATNDAESGGLDVMHLVNSANERITAESPTALSEWLNTALETDDYDLPPMYAAEPLTQEDKDYAQKASSVAIAFEGSSAIGGRFADLKDEFTESYIRLLAEKTGLPFTYRQQDMGTALQQLSPDVGTLHAVAGVDSRAAISDATISLPYTSVTYTLIVNESADLSVDNPVIALKTGMSAEACDAARYYENESVNNTYATYYDAAIAVQQGRATFAYLPHTIARIIMNDPEFDNVYVIVLPWDTKSLSIAVTNLRDNALANIINKGITIINSNMPEYSSLTFNEFAASTTKIDNVNDSQTYMFVAAVAVGVAAAAIFIVMYVIRRRHKIRKENDRTYDPLTKALTLQGFVEEGDELQLWYKNEAFSVLHLNIRGFKYINDVYTQRKGDEILIAMAEKIRDTLKGNGIFARTDADNFLILMRAGTQNDVLRFLTTLKAECAVLFNVRENDLHFEVYCGIFIGTPGGDMTITEKVSRAAIALRRASESKRNYVIFEERMRAEVVRESEIVRSMHDALATGEFTFFLQPQHHIKRHDKVLSAEALVRWIRPNGIIIFPGDFIPIFERNGFVVELDRYIYEQVCMFCAAHLDEPWFENFTIAVNVSRLDLYKSDFLEYYIGRKKFYNLPDHCIELEFTESLAFEDYATFKSMIERLSEEGFSTSLDDFGAGSSSLNVLKELSVDVLKMDRLFFIEEDESDENRNNSVISSVIAMARGLGMRVVAEGIEISAQIDFLRRIGCDVVQGFVYSRPLPQDRFIEYVKSFHGFAGFSHANSLLPTFVDDTPEVAKQKYVTTLNFVGAMVFEVDLDRDCFSMTSLGSGEYYFPVTGGSYTDDFIEYMKMQVHEDDMFGVSTMMSLQNLTACFYRGDASLVYEFRARVYAQELERFTDSFAWHQLTVCRIETSDPTRFLAMIFVRNVQERFDREQESKRAQEMLTIAIKAMRGQIYEIDVTTNKLTIIDQTAARGGFILKGGSAYEQFGVYIESYVHQDDRATIRRLCNQSVVKQFFLSDSDNAGVEYRALNDKGVYVWKALSFVKNPDMPGKVMMIVQDMSGIKNIDLSRESNGGLGGIGILDVLFTAVFVADFSRNLFNVVRSHNKDYYVMDGLSIDSARHYFSQQSQIIQDYNGMFAEMLTEDRLMPLFDGEVGEVCCEFTDYFNADGQGKRHYIHVTLENEITRTVVIMLREVSAGSPSGQNNMFFNSSATDALTGVSTEAVFRAKSDLFLSGEGEDGKHALVVMDVDGLSGINDRYGEIFGDMALCEMVRRLRVALGKENLFARVGGGTFAMLIKNSADRRRGIELVVNLMRVPVRDVTISCSIGLASYPEHGGDISDLYRNACMALAAAKAAGRGKSEVYEAGMVHPEFNVHEKSTAAIESDARYGRAVTDNLVNILQKSSDANQALYAALCHIGLTLGAERSFMFECDETGAFVSLREWKSDEAMDFDLSASPAAAEEFARYAPMLRGGAFTETDIIDGGGFTVRCALKHGDQTMGIIGFTGKTIITNRDNIAAAARVLGLFLSRNDSRETAGSR
jgi:diguanylate cyclase (GGDEF)-like protein